MICEAEVAFVGTTSMEIRITVNVEDMMSDSPSIVALTAFFTYVALDKQGKPCPVPGLIIRTEEEKREFELRKQKYLEKKKK